MCECEYIYRREDALTLKQLFVKLASSLPHIVVVADGFSFNACEMEISSGEVLLLHTSGYQDRALVHDADGRTLSIPLDYKHRFSFTEYTHAAGENLSLNQVVRRSRLPVEVQFTKLDELHFRNASRASMSRLTVLHVHSVPYFLASPVCPGCKGVPDSARTIALPVYLKQVSFCPVTELQKAGGGNEDYEPVVRRLASNLEHTYSSLLDGDKEIILLSAKPITDVKKLDSKITENTYILVTAIDSGTRDRTKKRDVQTPNRNVPLLPPRRKFQARTEADDSSNQDEKSPARRRHVDRALPDPEAMELRTFSTFKPQSDAGRALHKALTSLMANTGNGGTHSQTPASQTEMDTVRPSTLLRSKGSTLASSPPPSQSAMDDSSLSPSPRPRIATADNSLPPLPTQTAIGSSLPLPPSPSEIDNSHPLPSPPPDFATDDTLPLPPQPSEIVASISLALPPAQIAMANSGLLPLPLPQTSVGNSRSLPSPPQEIATDNTLPVPPSAVQTSTGKKLPQPPARQQSAMDNSLPSPPSLAALDDSHSLPLPLQDFAADNTRTLPHSAAQKAKVKKFPQPQYATDTSLPTPPSRIATDNPRPLPSPPSEIANYNSLSLPRSSARRAKVRKLPLPPSPRGAESNTGPQWSQPVKTRRGRRDAPLPPLPHESGPGKIGTPPSSPEGAVRNETAAQQPFSKREERATQQPPPPPPKPRKSKTGPLPPPPTQTRTIPSVGADQIPPLPPSPLLRSDKGEKLPMSPPLPCGKTTRRSSAFSYKAVPPLPSSDQHPRLEDVRGRLSRVLAEPHKRTSSCGGEGFNVREVVHENVYDEIPDSLVRDSLLADSSSVTSTSSSRSSVYTPSSLVSELSGRLSTLLKSNKAGKSSQDKDVGKGSLGIRENKFTAYYNVETASDGALTSAAVGVQRSVSSDDFGESEIRLKFENEPPSPLTHEMTSALECMTSDDVVTVLTKLKLSKYANSFKNQLVDGVILTQLTTDTLREDFGMTRLEAIRLMTFIERGHLPK